jgi:hypothetical protein
MIPLWIKIAYTAFTAATVAVYAVRYPLGNFLWFSDIALILTVPALWFESSFLASMLIVGLLIPEAFWNIGYFGRLLTGKRLGGLTDYMFDTSLPRYLRAISLFHVFLPALLIWMVHVLGYAPRAWIGQTVLAWIVLPVTYRFVDPALNVNWVRSHSEQRRQRVPPPVRIVLLMIGYPIVLYFPTHLLLEAMFR